MMAKYRQSFNKKKYEYLTKKYEKLQNKKNGLLTIPTRKKLLGKKWEEEAPSQNTVTRFYSLLRSRVATGLADLQLICEITDDSQHKAMFELTTHAELDDEVHTTDLEMLLQKLLRVHTWDGKNNIVLKSDVLWKSRLAEAIVNICYTFFASYGMVTSQSHKRTIEEAKNLIASEITNYAHRGEGKITDVSGKNLGEMVFVSQSELDGERVELSTDEKRDIEIKAYEKLAMERAKARLEAEALKEVEPSQGFPSRAFNDIIEKGKQITEEAVDEEMDRRIEEEKENE